MFSPGYQIWCSRRRSLQVFKHVSIKTDTCNLSKRCYFIVILYIIMNSVRLPYSANVITEIVCGLWLCIVSTYVLFTAYYTCNTSIFLFDIKLMFTKMQLIYMKLTSKTNTYVKMYAKIMLRVGYHGRPQGGGEG